MRIVEPDWVRDVVWWHCYPLGFTGAFPDTAASADTGSGGDGPHRLRRVTDWIEHARRLGASGLQLGPIFASQTHGYDTLDHLMVDPRLGDDADFDDLIATARAQGFRVALDGVFNHVARDFVHGRDEWLRRDPGTGEPVPFEGHDGLLTLAHDHLEVRDHVVEVMSHWLDRGVDGWRLDAAYSVDPAFWADVLPRVREQHPQAWFYGEVIHGDYAAITQAGRMDSVTQYELWKAIWSSLADGNPHELAHSLGRHDAMLDTFVPVTFVGNHDVTRIASRLDDPRQVPLAVVALLTVGGTPMIYAGDELGLQGVKEERRGGDDAVRPEFPPTPERWPDGSDPDRLRLHQELIGLRRRLRWLHAARTSVTDISHRHLTYESRAGDDAVLVTLNYEDSVLPRTDGAEVLVAAPGGDADAVAPLGWRVSRR